MASYASVNDSQRSCNQQVTKSGTTVKRIVGRLLHARCAVTLHPLDSHPIGEELGLYDQRAVAAFEMNMDFVLEDGTPLWEA